MPLPVSVLDRIGSNSMPVLATALVVPLVLASLVYLDARWRRADRRSLAPLAWGATTFFSGVGCVVVAACYVVVRDR